MVGLFGFRKLESALHTVRYSSGEMNEIFKCYGRVSPGSPSARIYLVITLPFIMYS